jgi:predicted permease
MQGYIERAFAGATVSYERRERRASGELRWVRVTLFPDREMGGRVGGAFVVWNDIEDDVRVRDALKSQQSQLRLFADNIPGPIAYLDKSLHYTFVNQAFAKKYFPNRSPVGQTITFGDTNHLSIVGVVGDVHQGSVDETPAPRIYASVYQIFRVKVNLVVRTQGDPQIMIKRIEDAIRSVDPQQTITSAFTLEDAIGEAVARPRLLTVLLGLFGAMGLVLGALGIYGVLAYLVTQRTREIGVRLALGASPRDVLRMVVGRGLRLAGLGVAIGLVAALVLTRLMQGVLYGVTPTDPLTFVGVAAALLAVAAFASWLPARRATRVDPLVALRSE